MEQRKLFFSGVGLIMIVVSCTMTGTEKIQTLPPAVAPSPETTSPTEAETTPTVIPPTPEEETVQEDTAPTVTLEEKKTETPMPRPSELDTVDITDAGNWLLKRKALEDVISTIDQTNTLFSKLLEVSSGFNVKRNKLDSEFDAFITSLGFDLGDLEQDVTDILEQMEEERAEEGDLTADERDFIMKLNENKNEIKQLQETIKGLQNLDDQLSKVINTVDGQIKAANNYQNQAWKNFQSIKKVLDDERAEDLYYKTEALLKSMQDIYTYLNSTLTQYFDGQAQTMRSQMSSIKSTLASLKSKGVDFEKRLTTFEQEDEAREEQREKEADEAALKKALAEQERKEHEQSLTHRLYRMLVWPLNTLKDRFGWLFNYFGSWFAPEKSIQEAVRGEDTIESSTIEISEFGDVVTST